MLRKKLPVVTAVILGLNVLGLIYEFNVGQTRAMYTYGMYEGALEDGQQSAQLSALQASGKACIRSSGMRW